MSATASAPQGKRAWRSGPSAHLLRRSRVTWRWILSFLALALLVAAVFWAWRPGLPRTILITLSDDREDRDVLPPVPFLQADLDLLRQWADDVFVPRRDMRLSEVNTDEQFVGNLLKGTGPGAAPRPADTLVIYIKGHGIAQDVGAGDQIDVQPLVIKSLNNNDLAGDWFRESRAVLNVGELLAELAKARSGPTLVILDAVHFNYDPRLGMLVNAFPRAVEQAVERNVPAGTKLWVLVAGGDGEVAVSDPAGGRSAFMQGFDKALRYGKGESRVIALPELAQQVRRNLRGLQPANPASYGTFFQTPKFINAKALATSDVPSLPRGLIKAEPAKENQPAPQNTAAQPAPADPAKAASAAAGQQAAQAAAQVLRGTPPSVPRAPTARDGASQAERAVVTQVQSAASAPTKANAAAEPATAQTTPDKTASSAAPPGGASQPAPPPSTPAPQPSATATAASVPSSPPQAAAGPRPPHDDLDRAWQLRDDLLSAASDGPADGSWSPVHFAPHHWRQLENLLVGFEERIVLGQEANNDRQTLSHLRRDLEELVRGSAASSPVQTLTIGECRAIALAHRLFLNERSEVAASSRNSFQAQQLGGLTAADAALQTFGQAAFRALDYIRIQGRMACVFDGGPTIEQDLEQVLAKLASFHRSFSIANLAEGRLTPARGEELSQLRSEVEGLLLNLNGSISQYAQWAAAQPLSAGNRLRLRSLLSSPLLAADDRWQIRQAISRPPAATVMATGGENQESGQADAAWTQIRPRLAKNVSWLQSLLQIGDSNDEKSALSSRLQEGNRSAAALNDPLEWTRIGRHFREFGQRLPQDIQLAASRRAGNAVAANTFEIYLRLLLVDGRDAGTFKTDSLVYLKQPLLPQRVFDHIAIESKSEQLPLTLEDQKDGARLRLTVRVRSENKPPFQVAANLAWNSEDLRIVWDETGQTPKELRPGSWPITLNDYEKEFVLKVIPLRPGDNAATARVPLTIQGSFGQAMEAATAQVTCILPGPDQIELLIAGVDGNPVPDYQGGDQGGNLALYPNRRGSYQLLLQNRSGVKKDLHAKLYRVPPAFAAEGGRLFDPRSSRALSQPQPAQLDGRIKTGSPDIWRLLQDFLIAQTDEKKPIELAATQSLPIAVPLAAPAPSAPAPAAPPAAAAAPSAVDCTDGLLLVLTKVGSQPGESYVKWIELIPHVPDDLLEIRRPRFQNGRLSFSVELKQPRFIEAIGLGQEPLKVEWDRRALPAEIVNGLFLGEITAEKPSLELSAAIPDQIRGPFYVHLFVAGYPRALLAELDYDQSGQVTIDNLKKNRLPLVHLGKLGYEKSLFIVRPGRPRLPFPGPPPEGVDVSQVDRDRTNVFALPIAAQKFSAQLAVDLQAEVAPRDFSNGARVQLSLDGQQANRFATDRQVKVQLGGVEAGLLRLTNQVTDFTSIPFPAINVDPGKDRRVKIAAEVTGDKVEIDPVAGRHTIEVILDRNPPVLQSVAVSPTVATQLSETAFRFTCRADDGPDGSGIQSVSFFVDANGDGKIDDAERAMPIRGRELSAADPGSYAAEFGPLTELKAGKFLVEAEARDRVNHAAVGRATFEIAPKRANFNRPSYGSAKKDEAPQGKKP